VELSAIWMGGVYHRETAGSFITGGWKTRRNRTRLHG
ncbi:hypothetical protein A2U01_0080866, partial [Trifolium medium]|nr:hypothetical protein [Trifolium medium]